MPDHPNGFCCFCKPLKFVATYLCMGELCQESRKENNTKQTNNKKKSLMFRRMSLKSLTSITSAKYCKYVLSVCSFVSLNCLEKIILLTYLSYILYRHSLNQPPIVSKTSPLFFFNTFCFVLFYGYLDCFSMSFRYWIVNCFHVKPRTQPCMAYTYYMALFW